MRKFQLLQATRSLEGGSLHIRLDGTVGIIPRRSASFARRFKRAVNALILFLSAPIP